MATRRALRLGAAALAVALLGACSSPKGNDESEAAEGCSSLRIAEIVIADNPEGQRTWQNDTAKAFEKETGIALRYETMGSATDEQRKILTSAVAHNGPDLFSMGTTFVPVANATDSFATLSPEGWEAIGGKDRFFKQSLEMSGRSESEQIAVPFVMRPFGMVYNTEMFKQKGIDEPPETWDEYVKIAKLFSDPAQGKYGTQIAYSSGFDPWKFIWMYSLQNGGDLVSKDLKTAQLDSAEVQQAVEQYFDLVTKSGAVDPASVTSDSPQVQAAFANEEIAMMANATPNVVPSLEEGSVKGKYAFAPNPTVPFGHDEAPAGSTPAGTIVSGDELAIASYSSCKQEALKYLEYVTRDEQQKDFYDIFGSVPANQKAAESLAQKDDVVASFIDATETAVPTPFVGGWANVQNQLTNVVVQNLGDLEQGDYDPQKVKRLLHQADQVVQRDLDREQQAEGR